MKTFCKMFCIFFRWWTKKYWYTFLIIDYHFPIYSVFVTVSNFFWRFSFISFILWPAWYITTSSAKPIDSCIIFNESEIYTYKHNWPLQSISQDIGLASHTTHVVCANFMREWWHLQFNVDSERQIFKKLFMAVFILLA